MKSKCKIGKPYSRNGRSWSLKWFDEGFVDSRGYFRVYMPDHPRAFENGQILRSWVAYEAYHGVAAKKGDIIHHKNGNRLDDSKENLEKVTYRIHGDIHKGTKIKCTCRNCGKYFYAKPSYIKRGGGQHCSLDCRWPKT